MLPEHVDDLKTIRESRNVFEAEVQKLVADRFQYIFFVYYFIYLISLCLPTYIACSISKIILDFLAF